LKWEAGGRKQEAGRKRQLRMMDIRYPGTIGYSSLLYKQILLELNTGNKKTPPQVTGLIKMGGDILSHTNAVPSARTGLTSLFGMGRGGPRRYSHLKRLNTLKVLSVKND
jgi:hypothetical protein